MEDDVVYFELNNWFCGRDYPDAEPFMSWITDFGVKFGNEDWVMANKLCIKEYYIDMSRNFLITAPRQWVVDNCPNLLTDFAGFLRFPDENGIVRGRHRQEFMEYCEENVGITYGEDC